MLLDIRLLLVQWAIILAAFAVLVGALNLLGVHWHKVRTRQKGTAYSILLIVSLFASAILGSALGTNNPMLEFFLEAIIIPGEAALMALLAVTLIYAAARLLRRRVDLMTFIFLGVVLVALLAATPLPFGKIPGASFIEWLLRDNFAAGGSRGILIGVALGALTTGLRVLFGVDRPYGGN
jgi:intracellular septation protein A